MTRICHDLFKGANEVANAYQTFRVARRGHEALWNATGLKLERLARALLERKTMTELQVRELLCPPGLPNLIKAGRFERKAECQVVVEQIPATIREIIGALSRIYQDAAYPASARDGA